MYKLATFIALISLIIFSCTKTQKSKTEITQSFYTASNEYNYNNINALTADTVTIIDGTYKMDYPKPDYYVLFQWDSTFVPNYQVKYIEQSGNDVFVKLSTTSKRFEFLGNNPLITTHKISFKNNKIRFIELNEYVETDFKTWTQNRDTLVNWIKIIHPELDGFINDMTKSGAENYVKAIELFNTINK